MEFWGLPAGHRKGAEPWCASWVPDLPGDHKPGGSGVSSQLCHSLRSCTVEPGSECPELFTLGWKTLRKMLWGWVEVGDKTGLCFKKSSALSSEKKEADQPQGAPPSLCLYPSWGAAGSPRRGRDSTTGLQFLSLKTGSCGDKPSPRVYRNLRPGVQGPWSTSGRPLKERLWQERPGDSENSQGPGGDLSHLLPQAGSFHIVSE